MNIKLDRLCITASTLNQVIRNRDTEEFEKVLYEQCLSIIRRMYDKQSFTNEAILHGKKYEQLLIESKYSDSNMFLVQEQFNKEVFIDGQNIPFRATLDVHDILNDDVIEIKCPFYKPIDGHNAQAYADNYEAQLQIQLLCSGLKTARVVIYRDGKLFECKSLTIDNNFIKNNKAIIIRFWEVLNELHTKYQQKDRKVMHEVEQYEDSPLNRDLDLISDIVGYNELAQIIEQKNIELAEFKERITSKIDGYGIEKFETPFMTIYRRGDSQRCDYQKILKDKYNFNLDTDISEEERGFFMKKVSGSWTFKPKQLKQA